MGLYNTLTQVPDRKVAWTIAIKNLIYALQGWLSHRSLQHSQSCNKTTQVCMSKGEADRI